jgi:hypothetical protein
MSIPVIYLLLAALPLVIPLAVIAGQRRPASPIVVSGGGALAAFAAFWLLLGGVWSLRGYGSPSLLVSALVFFGGILLFVAAWALALAAAARERRWRWLAVLALAGYVSTVAIVVMAAPPDPCLFGPPPGVAAESVGFTCIATNPLGQLLVLVAYCAGPAATLVFGLRARIPGLRTDAAVESEPDQVLEPEQDSGLEVYRERL